MAQAAVRHGPAPSQSKDKPSQLGIGMTGHTSTMPKKMLRKWLSWYWIINSQGLLLIIRADWRRSNRMTWWNHHWFTMSAHAASSCSSAYPFFLVLDFFGTIYDWPFFFFFFLFFFFVPGKSWPGLLGFHRGSIKAEKEAWGRKKKKEKREKERVVLNQLFSLRRTEQYWDTMPCRAMATNEMEKKKNIKNKNKK